MSSQKIRMFRKPLPHGSGCGAAFPDGDAVPSSLRSIHPGPTLARLTWSFLVAVRRAGCSRPRGAVVTAPLLSSAEMGARMARASSPWQAADFSQLPFFPI